MHAIAQSNSPFIRMDIFLCTHDHEGEDVQKKILNFNLPRKASGSERRHLQQNCPFEQANTGGVHYDHQLVHSCYFIEIWESGNPVVFFSTCVYAEEESTLSNPLRWFPHM